MKQTVLKMTQEFMGLQLHLWFISRLWSGRPHTAPPISKINNIKDLPLILLISLSSLLFLSKHPKQSFCYTFYSLTTSVV